MFEGALLESSGRVERAGITSLRIGTSGVSELSETGPRGFVRTRAPGEILALVPGWWADAFPGSASGLAASAPRDGAPEPFIELVDGQRFVGHPGRIGSEGEAIAWVHEKFGTLMLPIDEVARFVLRPLPGDTLSLPGTPSADTLWLINGDRLEGFVETVGSRAGGEGFTLTIDTGGASAGKAGVGRGGRGGGNRVTVPVDQVVRARLANPRRALAGPVAWLNDGSVVALSSVSTDIGGSGLLLGALTADATANAPGTTESPVAPAGALFGPGDINAIAFDSSLAIPLAELEMLSHRPLGLSRRPGPRMSTPDARPAALNAADVMLPGPMEVEWAMPPGTVRIIGTARLDEADWMWGECVLVVEVVSGSTVAREVVRMSLGGTTVAAPLAAELGTTRAGDRLRVRIEPGELGPIRDRVRLERVLLLK